MQHKDATILLDMQREADAGWVAISYVRIKKLTICSYVRITASAEMKVHMRA